MSSVSLPPLISEVLIDIYIDKAKGHISIVYDRPLNGVVKQLEFYKGSSRLIFVYKDGREQDFGETLNPDIAALFLKTDMAGLFQMSRGQKISISVGKAPIIVK